MATVYCVFYMVSGRLLISTVKQFPELNIDKDAKDLMQYVNTESYKVTFYLKQKQHLEISYLKNKQA